jgi:putative ABC transport system permease protein
MSWRRRLYVLLHRCDLDRQMHEEMLAHLEMQTEENIRQGMSPEQARAAARRQFGGVEAMKDRVRDRRGVAWLENLLQDVGWGLRVFRRSPAFALAAVLTLALGVGVNTAMFSVLDQLLLRPAPYPAPAELVRLYRTTAQSASWPHALPDVRDLQAASRTLAALTPFCWWTYSLAQPGQPAQQIPGVTASADLFATLGVQPVLGRAFTAGEQQPGRDAVAVISHGFWIRHFQGDPGAIGQPLRVDGETVTVIGVMPAGAEHPLFWGPVDLWRPLTLSTDWRADRSVRWLQVIGRLAPGLPLARAQAELDVLAAGLARQYPATATGAGLRLAPLQRTVLDDVSRRLVWLTFGLAGFVLLIACANLANLQLARGAARLHDLALRAALGAGRARILREALIETILLALVGGALGLGLAALALDALATQLPLGRQPGAGPTFTLDVSVLAFTLLASFAAGLLAGAAPAWLAARPGVAAALTRQARGGTGDRSRHRLRHALLVAQIALSLLLLAGASGFARGLQRFASSDPGWRSDGLLAGTITLPVRRYSDPQQRQAFHDRLLTQLRALPGVQQAALASALPIREFKGAAGVVIEGAPPPPPGAEPLAYPFVVSPDYFATLGIELLEGTLFPRQLRADHPAVVVVSASMARALWPDGRALGKRLRDTTPGQPRWREVIGVVKDVAFAGHLGAVDTRFQLYHPLVQDPWGYVTVVLRATDPATLAALAAPLRRAVAALAAPLRRAVAALDADLPVAELRPVTEAIAAARGQVRFVNRLLAGFGALGLLLAMVGLYGVVSGLVAQRTREFGIRLALGGQPHQVVRMVLARGALLTGIGTAIGLVAARFISDLLGAIVPALPPQDLLGLGAAVLPLAAVALLASLLPARRAARLDPLLALRTD